MKKRISKYIFLSVGFLLLVLASYIFYGLAELQYAGTYESSKGPIYSLKSMTFGQKAIYFSFFPWIAFLLFLATTLVWKGVKLFRLKS